MKKFIKTGRVVVVLSGKYAGRKAIIMKTSEGHGNRKYGHAVLAGIDRYPRKITKSMTSKKTSRRAKIKPFIKEVNFNHFMPTRYEVDWDVKKYLPTEKTPEAKKGCKKEFKEFLQKAYLSNKNGETDNAKTAAAYFFTKLRF